jgi:hypothetical protein
LDDFIGIPDFDYSKIAKVHHKRVQRSRVNMTKEGLDPDFKKGFMQY